MRIACLAAVGLCLAAVPLGGQRGDTLRYRESTTAHHTLRLPSRQVQWQTTQESLISVVAHGDTLHAWFDSLSLVSDTEGSPPERPDPASLIGRVYRLSRVPGRPVRTVSAPAIPGEVARTSDLAHEFDDFFVSVPGGVLEPGREWTDTVTIVRSAAADSRQQIVRRYRVLGDTTVAGRRGRVVEVREASSLVARRVTAASTTESRLTGTDRGFAVLAGEDGRMMLRVRAGETSGTITAQTGDLKTSYDSAFTYEHRIELVP
jgi:hypothetical protein